MVFCSMSEKMQLRTLDVLLFEGTSVWPSKLIEWITDSQYSHVGLGALNPTYIDAQLEGEYMIESGPQAAH